MGTPRLEPIRFAAIKDAPSPTWRRIDRYPFAAGLSQLPLSDSELLLTSAHLPIAVDCLGERPRVIAVLDPLLLRKHVIDETGIWQRAYLPLALRCMPFRLATSGGGSGALEIATNLEGVGGDLPLAGELNGLSNEAHAVHQLLRRLEEGKSKLQRAASQLLISGILTPLRPANEAGKPNCDRIFTVSRERFASLSKGRIALLAQDSFLPIDLAVSCMFSQRQLSPKVVIEASETPVEGISMNPAVQLEAAFSTFKVATQIDGQPLFSYDEFVQSGPNS